MVAITELYRILFGRGELRSGDVIEMAEHGRAGGVNTGQGLKYTKDVAERVEIDEPDSSTVYIGLARMGAATSASVWQIIKVAESGTTQSITFADGNDNYDNEWDERTNLDYS